MIETNYEVELLGQETFKIFKGVYNDFKSKAISEYKFELEPLEYEEFISAVENGYMKCIILKENFIPTAFLVYTTSISESIELNLIHCLGNEDEATKYKKLIEKFYFFCRIKQDRRKIKTVNIQRKLQLYLGEIIHHL